MDVERLFIDIKYITNDGQSMISGAQIRAARALLGMSAAELAERSQVGWATIQRFEGVEGIPQSRSGTLLKIKETLERAEIMFVGEPDTSPGVQLRREPRVKGKSAQRASTTRRKSK